MPMPKPHDREDKDTFIDRCMENEMMNDEFSDPKQRRAVCETQWGDRHKEKSMSDLRYQHILSGVLSAVWALLPAKWAELWDFLGYVAAGGSYTTEEVQQRLGAAVRPEARTFGTIAVLPLYGVIVPRGNLLVQASGATSLQKFMSGFRQVVSDPGISAIILDVDSPGGEVGLVPEAAMEIHAARSSKPVLAVANTMAASAAYWLASQASELYVTPSGEVGSIGVLAAHEDISVRQEKAGIRTTLITAGKYKSEGSPFGPLGDEGLAAIQERVNDYYSMFTRDVGRGRGVSADEVRAGYGEGRVVGAKRAKALGMVDGIATVDEVIERAARLARQQARSVGAIGEEVIVEAGTQEALPVQGSLAAVNAAEIEIRRRRLRARGR